MPQQQNLRPERSTNAPKENKGVYFGIPLGELGPVVSLLMACTLGFLTFFVFTFLGIVGISIYNGMGHHLDLAASYKLFALPAGSVVLVVSLVFFATLWIRRKVARG